MVFKVFGAEDTTARLDVWPQWRGPQATGSAQDADPPVTWAENKNVRWKVLIPGTGHSSPIVWKDRVFVTTAVSTGKTADPALVTAVENATPKFHRRSARIPRNMQQFTVIALDRRNGSVLWRKTVCERVPHAGTHADGSWASSSPVTDGERVYAYFGSHGLYALDMAGNLQWEKQFAPLKIKANFGGGSSPVLSGNSLILIQDQEGPSWIVALDKTTGKEIWKVQRDEATSWATPLVLEYNGRRQVFTSGTTRMRSYDVASGALLWEAEGMTKNAIPCPVADKGIVFCTTGFRGSALSAIRLDKAKGNLKDRPEALVWSRNKDTPYVPSPLLYNGLLYFLKVSSGALTCVDAATGSEHYSNRKLEGIR